ncbi:MAG: hypothetical protein HZB43_07055 [candidate division Zixibacteria bacterium]|nr:hypothetical protein [candidate division Zixibacteria bacterium]
MGKSTYVAGLVRREPSLAAELVGVLLSEDKTAVAHAAHALMEVAMSNPEIIQPLRRKLMVEISDIGQWEVREQLCKVLPRLWLSPKDRNIAAGIFVRYLADKSSIVRACALQGLADLAMIDPKRRVPTRKLIEAAAQSGTAAVRARARRLLAGFDIE